MFCKVFCSKAVEKLVQKTDILFFLGKRENTGREKILCLQAAKIYFGSAIQLCYQIWILQVTHYNDKIFERISQYLSIIMSFVMITKNSIDLISYSRARPKSEEEEEANEEFSTSKVFETISLYLSWLPVVLTSLLFKVATINLFTIFYGWKSLVIVFGIFLVNFTFTFIFGFIGSKCNRLSLVHKDKSMPEGAENYQDKVMISYSNIFVISRPVNTLR